MFHLGVELQFCKQWLTIKGKAQVTNLIIGSVCFSSGMSVQTQKCLHLHQQQQMNSQPDAVLLLEVGSRLDSPGPGWTLADCTSGNSASKPAQCQLNRKKACHQNCPSHNSEPITTCEQWVHGVSVTRGSDLRALVNTQKDLKLDENYIQKQKVNSGCPGQNDTDTIHWSKWYR